MLEQRQRRCGECTPAAAIVNGGRPSAIELCRENSKCLSQQTVSHQCTCTRRWNNALHVGVYTYIQRGHCRTTIPGNSGMRSTGAAYYFPEQAMAVLCECLRPRARVPPAVPRLNTSRRFGHATHPNTREASVSYGSPVCLSSHTPARGMEHRFSCPGSVSCMEVTFARLPPAGVSCLCKNARTYVCILLHLLKFSLKKRRKHFATHGLDAGKHAHAPCCLEGARSCRELALTQAWQNSKALPQVHHAATGTLGSLS